MEDKFYRYYMKLQPRRLEGEGSFNTQFFLIWLVILTPAGTQNENFLYPYKEPTIKPANGELKRYMMLLVYVRRKNKKKANKM